ncbi:MAG TPA: prolipoprotein diacylglyceryl transferase [Stellaceae bacterium]|nr:prolipoprotein diacylglyceryl transferase [Stellaceae bacterium]
MIFAIPYPAIDPVLVEIGPFAIRWYALAYIAGLLMGWRYCVAMARRPPKVLEPAALDDLLVWVTLGVVLGGRTGYVLFYDLPKYIEHPVEALMIWKGGMSFHGGAIGVILALYLFARQRKIDFQRLGDILVCAVPIGLFFGRIANFINGELYGRATHSELGMLFPSELLADPAKASQAVRAVSAVDPRLDTAGAIVDAYHRNPEIAHLLAPILTPRYPSQLFEAFLEGAVLFTVLFVLQRYTKARDRRGFLSGVFLAGYGLARIVAEFFRQPDQQLGYLLLQTFTMGQLLSVPLLIVGTWMIRRSYRQPLAA